MALMPRMTPPLPEEILLGKSADSICSCCQIFAQATPIVVLFAQMQGFKFIGLQLPCLSLICNKYISIYSNLENTVQHDRRG
jgi:hypothetical protein